MPAQLSSKRIMIVDDDRYMRTLIRRMLAQIGIQQAEEAEGAKQALEQIETGASPLDLVICDWNMPEMSGIELFNKVHAVKPELRFLMLTGRADADSVIAAKKAGVAAYIVKPVSPAALKAKIALLTGATH